MMVGIVRGSVSRESRYDGRCCKKKGIKGSRVR